MRKLILLALFFSLTAAINASNLNFKQIKELHYQSAFHLAESKLIKLISSEKRNEANDSLLGEYYQQRALIANDAGYPMQYKQWVDSMYYYKSKLKNDIYFVEYATFQLRTYALFQNSASAFDLIDTAQAVLNKNRNQAHLIDTLFFHLNVLNTYRNGFKKKSSDFHDRKWELVKQYEKLPFDQQKNPYYQYLYYRYLGNFYQDFVFSRSEQYSRPYSDSAFQKSTAYYQKAVNCFSKISPSGNEFTAYLKTLIALQYIKNIPNYEEARKWIRQAEKELQITTKKGTYYRSMSTPVFMYKLYAHIALYDGDFKERQYVIEQLESLWKLRRLYRSQFFNLQPNLFFHAYTSFPEDEIFKLYAAQLNNNSSLKDSSKYLSKIWSKYSVRFSWEAYYESTKRLIGEKKFTQYNQKLDKLQIRQMIALDQLFLSNKSQYENTVDSLSLAFEQMLESSPEIFRSYQIGIAQQTLEAFQSTLQDDQSFILYCISRPFDLHKSGFQYALVVDIKKTELIRLNMHFLFGSSKMKKIPIGWKEINHSNYNRFFSELHPKLRDKKRIKIGTNPFINKINFDQLIIDTNFTSLKNTPFLIKEFAFNYTQNQSVDYLNKIYSNQNQSKSNAVALNQCETKTYTKTPFTTQFGLEVLETTNAQRINTKQTLLKSKKYNFLLILNHGKLDSLLKIGGHYRNQESLFKNEILLCDSSVNMLEVDKAGLAANLAVLANCNSGLGLNAAQSGRYDFSPILIKNGSASVITTVFEVDDYATAKILQTFWEYYHDGFPLSIALQKAKLHFLEEVDDPQHYQAQYWSGLRLDGIDQTLKTNDNNLLKYLGGVFFLGLIVISLIYIKKKR